MKNLLLALFVLALGNFAKAQSYFGLQHDNYAGVHGALYNPATIVDSRFKFDLNLVSSTFALGNDMYSANLSEAFESGYDFDTKAEKSFTNSNNLITNFDVLGPSFMFNLAPKHAIAITTRLRSFTNLVGVNGFLINEFLKDKGDKNDFNYVLGSPNFVQNNWAEVGLSYATVLLEKGTHFLKAGVTAKRLLGVANFNFQGENVSVNFKEDTVAPENSLYSATGTGEYSTSEDFSKNTDFEINANSIGLGMDFGLVYEWRPDYNTKDKKASDFKNVNKYKLRLGVSLTDLGYINYTKGITRNYNLNNSFTLSEFDGSGTIGDFLQDTFNQTSTAGTVKTNLPTAFHADVDWKIGGKFYLNLNGDFSMVDSEELNQNSIENRFSITPRLEMKWLSLYVPVSSMQYSGTQIGAGIRTGIFFLGSGTAISNAFTTQTKAIDVHFGMKFFICQKKK